MDVKPVDAYDVEEVLDSVEALHRARVEDEARLLQLAVQFAVIHNVDTLPAPTPDTTGAGRRWRGRERAVMLGGSGTPKIAEFAPAEFGARMQLGTFAAKMLLADALDAKFRLPKTWQRVLALQARVPLVRHLAQATRHLSKDAAGKVDAAVADLIDGRLPRARFETIVAGKITEADPETAAAREHATANHRFAHASRSTDHGMKTFTLRAPAPTIIRFDATVAFLADALAALGDSDSDQDRRIKACLIMANPVHAVELLTAFAAHRATNPPPGATSPASPGPAPTDEEQPPEPPAPKTGPAPEQAKTEADPEAGAGPQPGQPGHPLCRPTPFHPGDPIPALAELASSGGYRFTPEKLLPSVTVYIHLSHDALVRDPNGVARFEGGGPITHDFIRRYLAPQHRFTITGVLDLAHLAPADGYEIPTVHRTAVKILSPADTFPFATTLAGDPDTEVDVDHSTRYVPQDEGGPPGQSRIGNYGLLGRFHHRIKTFGPWSVKQPYPGVWIWRDPHGHYYLVDHTGTRKITPPPQQARGRPRGRPRGRSRSRPDPDHQPPGQARGTPTEPSAHNPDLEIQIWDASLHPALEYTFQHTS